MAHTHALCTDGKPPRLVALVYASGLRLSADIAQQLIQGIRAAVSHLHQSGLLHGDLYAHNTLCDLSSGKAVLTDMGAAAMLGDLSLSQQKALQQIELRALQHLEDEIHALVQ